MKKKILLEILTLVFSASVAVGAATAFASGGVSALAEGGSTKFRDPLNNGRMTAVDDEVGKTAIDLKAADLQASISRALYTGKVDISKTFEMEITLDKMNADGGIFVSFLSTADDFPMAGYGDGFAINFWDETAWGHPQNTWLRADPITYSKAGEENLQAQWRVCSDESTQYIGTTFYMRVWDYTDTQLAVKIKWGDSYDDNRTIKKSDLPEGFDYTDCNLLIAPFVDRNHTTYADDMKVTVDVYEQYNVTCGSTGNGSVTASAQGVVKERQEVTFTANPQEGYQVKEATLNGTHVDLLPDNTYKTTVTGDIAFHVEFEEIPVYYTVTATAGDNGRVEASAQGSVRENSEVVFTVYPEEGYRIKQATVNGEPIEMQGTVYTTTVTGDIAFHVEFEEIPPEVITHTVTVQTEGNGRVEATAQGTVEEGTVVTFTAIPDEGNRVQQATVNGSPVELTAQLTHEETVNGDITFKVVFEEIPITYFNVSATAGEGGEVTADHEGQVPSGTEVTFTVKPALSHKIGTATVNGDPVDVVDGTYTVTVSDDVEFHVDFVAYLVDPATKFTDGLNNGRVDAVLDGEDVRLSLAVSDGQKSISRAVYTQPVSLEYFEMSFTIENLSLYGGFRISFLTQPGDYPMEGYGDGFCIQNILHVPVAIENDANACALAEWKYGAGRGSENMVFLTFGTGLGAGLILNGRLYRGANGNAGEVGHMRLAPEGPVGYGKAGSFEGFCSGGGIASLALYLAAKRQTVPAVIQRHGNAVTAKILAEAAFDGDAFALEVYRKCGEMLGRGLALVCDILNPQLVVLGGVFMRSSALLVPSMTKALEAEALGVNLEVMKIVSAGLGEEIGDYAAVAVAAGIL